MRPTNIKIASIVCVIGAIVAFVALGFIVFPTAGEINIAAALFILVIAMLFFALAGQFHEGGLVKSPAIALLIVAITIGAIISAYCLQDAFEIGFLILLFICVAIPAVIAATETEWFKYEKI